MRKCFVNLSLLFIFFACSSNVEIELKDDISGIVSIFINVNKEFEKIRKELLTTLVGGEIANMPLFPVDEIKKYFKNGEEKLGLKLLSIKTQGDSINLVVKFDNLIKILGDYMEKSDMSVFKIEKKMVKILLSLILIWKMLLRILMKIKNILVMHLRLFCHRMRFPCLLKNIKMFWFIFYRILLPKQMNLLTIQNLIL